jgi:hypothetical protein
MLGTLQLKFGNTQCSSSCLQPLVLVSVRLCCSWVAVRVKESESGRLVRFWKRTDRWFTFSWSICDKTTTLLGVSRVTVSKVMSACTNHGKTTSAKRNSGRKSTLTNRDRRILRRIFEKSKNCCSTGYSRTEYSSRRPRFHKNCPTWASQIHLPRWGCNR